MLVHRELPPQTITVCFRKRLQQTQRETKNCLKMFNTAAGRKLKDTVQGRTWEAKKDLLRRHTGKGWITQKKNIFKVLWSGNLLWHKQCACLATHWLSDEHSERGWKPTSKSQDPVQTLEVFLKHWLWGPMTLSILGYSETAVWFWWGFDCGYGNSVFRRTSLPSWKTPVKPHKHTPYHWMGSWRPYWVVELFFPLLFSFVRIWGGWETHFGEKKKTFGKHGDVDTQCFTPD